MTVKIVTDSTADLPPQLAMDLGVTVVPVYVRFGDQIYRDRVDISEDEFYQRLLHDPIHPSTTQPTPQDFADVYQKLSQEAEGIISIKDGELVPAGRVRSRTKGIDRLVDFVKNAVDVQDVAIVYNTTPHEGQALVGRMGSILPKERIRLARLGPALGVHAGPGVLLVALRRRV